MAKSIEKIYDDIFKIKDEFESVLENAQKLIEDSKEFPGIIYNVISEQITKYFAPAVKKLEDDDNTPGSLKGLIRFLDAVPLAYTRERESPSIVDPIVPNTEVQTPVGTENEIQDIPLNTSYNKPQGESIVAETPHVQESLDKKTYKVIRTSEVLDSLGDERGKSNKGSAVFESFSKEEAQTKADFLNSIVTPEEKEFLGTEYIVEEKSKEW